jgi:DNA-binding MarR family transcriptional regulator
MSDWVVTGCAECHQLQLIKRTDYNEQDLATCRICGAVHKTDQLRTIARHPEREGAAELRARQLARNAGQGDEYANTDDYGVLGDLIESDNLETVTPDPAAGWHPKFFEAAAESIERWEDDLFQPAAEDALGFGDDWYSDAAAYAGVAHPGQEIVDELVTDRLRNYSEVIEQASLADAGSLTLTLDTHIAPDWSLTIDESHLAPTTLQTMLFDEGGGVVDAMIDALRSLAADCPPDTDVTTYLIESGVTALDGAYARLAAASLSDLDAGDQRRLWALVSVTQSLGGQTELGSHSTLDDIRDGPIALLGAAGETPTIEFQVDRDIFEAKSTQRRRFVTHLRRLTPGIDVRISASRLTLRHLLDRHGDQLPTSVREDAQQRVHSRDTVSTITEQRARNAADALDALGLDHPAWDVLVSISHSQTESRAYSDLYADDQFAVSDSAIRRRIGRLRDAGLVESEHRDDEKHVSLTPVGLVALKKHPDINLASEDNRRRLSHSLSGGWFTEHTDQAELPDCSPPQSTVSDPRNNPASTVYTNRAWEGRDRRAGGTREETHPSLTTSSPSSSSPSTRYLGLSKHHATAAAASEGHISLVDRSLSNVSVSRDHREPGFSYDPDRDEVVVQVDFSPSIALTATRLCAALLSDPAFEQVLTPERLAGHPGGMSLEGLAISNPYVLRNGACLGWLRDMDATANAFRTRLMNAKCELLSMTSDLHTENAQIDSETAQSLLKKAHGLMGVAIRLYDLLDIDVVRELQFPNSVPEGDMRRELGKFIVKSSSISGRYGAYSGYRVLHEDRAEKRDQLLSKPSIDRHDPEGTLLGPWVLTGEGAAELDEWLSQSAADLELQEDGENFAPFVLDGNIVDGNRRRAVAETVTRVLSFKENLRPDRQAISVLAALSSDVVAAAEAVSKLGSENEQRTLDMQDVRYGLSQLPPERIVPNLGGNVVSKVIAALIDAQERVSTAELAEIADCSNRSLSSDHNEDIFAELEVAGLLDREDLGEGKETLWRLQIPFRNERHDNEPLPTILTGQEPPTAGDEWHLSNAVFEVLVTAADEYDVEYEFDFGTGVTMEAFAGSPPIERDLQLLLSKYSDLKPIVRLLATLLDQGNRIKTDYRHLSLGKHPDPQQSTLEAAVSSVS